MSSGKRIRNLTKSDKIAVTLGDVLTDLVACQSSLLDLEYKNQRTDLKECKAQIRKAMATFIALKKRVDHEVTDEVLLHAKQNSHKHTGDINRLGK